MDDYSRYQQSKGRYNDPPARGAPQQYGYDPKMQAPPPRGNSSRGGGPDSYNRAPSNSNSSYGSPSPNAPPSYRSDTSDRDRRELFGDRGAQQGNPASRGGYGDDRYAGQQDSRYGGGRDGYGDSNGRYGAQQDRYGAQQDRYREDHDAYGDSRFAQQQDDEEADRIKQQIKFSKQDTLASTRNALNKIREAEDMGSQTLTRLGQQSEQLGNVNRNLDAAKAYSDRAVDKAGELKQLQRSMFMPVFKNPFNKKSRELREIEAVRQDHKEHAATLEDIRKYEFESQQRLANLERQQQRPQYGHGDTSARSERERYQFEADAEDDAIEDEIDSNMDALAAATGRLKNMALTMNGELESQNNFLSNTDKKVAPLAERIATTTYRINKIK